LLRLDTRSSSRHRSVEGDPVTTLYSDSCTMRRLPSQFRLRTLLIVVAVAAVAFEVYVLLRPPKPKYVGQPPRAALRVARLRHAGDWNIAAQAIPNLMDTLRKPPYAFDLAITEKELFPRDPNLIYYPLIYMHGRSAFSFTEEDVAALRGHFWPGGGTLFADAACGSPAFDAAFRRFVGELMSNNPLVPIPTDDELYTTKIGADLSKVQYTKAAGGKRDFPQLEGVKINGYWAIIYSKYGIGCALDRDHDGGCKGYVREDAAKIGGNVLIYSHLP
jgi:hypothetical protein